MAGARIGRLAGYSGLGTTVALLVAGVLLVALSAVLNTANAPEAAFGELMLAIAAIVVLGRFLGGILARLGQPRVMGEVVAGILLGPSLVGTLGPSLIAALHQSLPALVPQVKLVPPWPFSPETVTALRGAADIGLAFYMFLVGLELDPRLLSGRLRQAATISLSSIVLPFALGVAVALALLDRPDLKLIGSAAGMLAFAIFIGVSMSITAFPVLARILVERRMISGPTGAIVLAAAAVDDVAAWCLLAFAAAIAKTGIGPQALEVIGLAALFCLVVAVLGRPLLARVSRAFDEAGQIPAAWIVGIFLGVLLAAFLAQRAGVASIFGAFVLGLAMPRRSELTHDLSRRIEDFVVVLLLPLFFVSSGLKTDVTKILGHPELLPLTLLLILIAIAGKWAGAAGAARLTGQPPRAAMAIGALMNTRGLTELIVLNIGLSLNVISQELFTMLVLMALVTTFMTGPALRIIDPRRELAVPVEEEFRSREAPPPTDEPAPPSAVLVAAQSLKNVDGLLAIAVPLATSPGSSRELILARLVAPSKLVTGIAIEDRELTRATGQLNERRDELVARGIQARSVVFTSPDPGADLVELSARHGIDLLLLDGRRSLLNPGLPAGAVGEALASAPCDVAVLIERQAAPVIDAGHPVVVPFGGAEHDWAALELGGWIASTHGTSLRLVGVSAGTDGGGDPGLLLADTSLVIQRLTGIRVETVVVGRGRPGLLAASSDAGLLVVGLSDRWRKEGLGEFRTGLVTEAPVPILFVRRGSYPGALAPRGSLATFRWSTVGSPLASKG